MAPLGPTNALPRQTAFAGIQETAEFAKFLEGYVFDVEPDEPYEDVGTLTPPEKDFSALLFGTVRFARSEAV